MTSTPGPLGRGSAEDGNSETQSLGDMKRLVTGVAVAEAVTRSSQRGEIAGEARRSRDTGLKAEGWREETCPKNTVAKR